MATQRKSGVTGYQDVVANLRALAGGLSPKDIDAAAKTSLEPMRQATMAGIRANRNYVGKYDKEFFTQPKTPRRGGYVDQGIVFQKDEDSSRTSMSYKIGATRRARYLLHLLEFGTAPHYEPNFHGGWMHPGATAKPAMTPAFEQGKDAVLGVFGERIWLILAAKISSRGSKK